MEEAEKCSGEGGGGLLVEMTRNRKEKVEDIFYSVNYNWSYVHISYFQFLKQ